VSLLLERFYYFLRVYSTAGVDSPFFSLLIVERRIIVNTITEIESISVIVVSHQFGFVSQTPRESLPQLSLAMGMLGESSSLCSMRVSLRNQS